MNAKDGVPVLIEGCLSSFITLHYSVVRYKGLLLVAARFACDCLSPRPVKILLFHSDPSNVTFRAWASDLRPSSPFKTGVKSHPFMLKK